MTKIDTTSISLADYVKQEIDRTQVQAISDYIAAMSLTEKEYMKLEEFLIDTRRKKALKEGVAA